MLPPVLLIGVSAFAPCLLPLVVVMVRFFLAASFFGGGLGGFPSFSRLLGPLLVVLLLSLALFFGCFALFGGGPGGNSCAPRLVPGSVLNA